MQANDIKNRLKSLIQEASTIDPNLAKRLEEINRWVKDIKPGSLIAKPVLRLFLLQLISDALIWLDIKSLTSQQEQQTYYEEMTTTEKYWYSELFSKWLSENDPKFSIWRRKLMTGEFSQDDANFINLISSNIENRGGNVVKRYIADLSMATDIIVSSRQDKPLCIQITSLSEEFYQQKSDDWERTLRFWKIERGLFLSYNPSVNDFLNQIVNIVLYNSVHLKAGIYLRFNL